MQEIFTSIINSEFMGYFMLILRILTPLLGFFIAWRAFTSFKKTLRTNTPVIMLEDKINDIAYHVLYWENSIGRSKSCDIVIEDSTVSRDHAVLLRRSKGWFLCDTESKSGITVNGEKIHGRKLIEVGDEIVIGRTALTLESSAIYSDSTRMGFTGFFKTAASPVMLLLLTNLVFLSMALQLYVGSEEARMYAFFIFLGLVAVTWLFYLVTTKIFKRRTFEIETIGLLLSGIGILLLSAHNINGIITQFGALVIGLIIFSIMLVLMRDMDKINKLRPFFAVLAILFFLVNLVIGTEINGSKNWIFIGPLSIQPSEIIKIAFVIVGASTLDKLQTKKNIGEFIAFAGICMAFLFIMRDFGTAIIFFAGFLIIAFMRSGSIRTISLILAVAVIGVVMILYFRPYVADRFAGWGNIWDHINDNLGYQQTRTLTYIASGGLFGIGLGNGYLHYIAAAESDLVFGLITEEQGLFMGALVIFCLVLLFFFVQNTVRRSRSTFYSITSCAVIGMLMFQACLNIFGSTDILPLTGVTLPFISLGGTSMMSVWGMIAFIKAADERTYGFKRVKHD